MKLRKLKIENFRGIKDLELDLGDTTVLIGENNSGKTAVLEVLRLCISVPDPVFQSAERLAGRMRKSRSQLYSEAVEEYVARHDPDTVTEQINAVCDEVDTRPDPFLTEAARRILAGAEW